MFSREMKRRLVVIIPAYEPTEDFIKYARDVSAFSRQLIVVNDGSGDEYNSIFDSIGKIENAVCLSYNRNRGKGYALKYAISYCLGDFELLGSAQYVKAFDCTDAVNAPLRFPEDTVIVTADCDGQHKMKDILRVYRAASENTDSLVLGSRDFRSPNVPLRSRLGNQPMRHFFRFLYGQSLYDTQTGLRGFSLGVAERLINVEGDRFEYELGCLIYARRERIPILEVSIDTVYPENPADHKSHFKTISDSLRVLGVLLRGLGGYILSSILSAALDVLLFMLLTVWVFPTHTALNTLGATLLARAVSSVLNYVLNHSYVFKCADRTSILRYYVLWTCQIGASYGIVSLFRIIGVSGIWLTVVKGVGDLALAFISYRVQQHWVFAPRDSCKIWGPAVTLVHRLARTFSKHYRANVLKRREGVVYVARHLNMHGPYTTLKWLGFEVRPMVLSAFNNEDECYRQYADYTFTERVGKKRSGFHLGAYLASRVVPPLVRSIGAIPVFRGDIKAVKTFRESIKALVDGDPIIVFPDVDYKIEGESCEIYDGFLYLGELYRKRTGKSLSFIPLYIDDEENKIEEYPAISVDDFRRDSKAAKEYLECAINGKPEKSTCRPSSYELEFELQNS